MAPFFGLRVTFQSAAPQWPWCHVFGLCSEVMSGMVFWSDEKLLCSKAMLFMVFYKVRSLFTFPCRCVLVQLVGVGIHAVLRQGPSAPRKSMIDGVETREGWRFWYIADTPFLGQVMQAPGPGSRVTVVCQKMPEGSGVACVNHSVLGGIGVKKNMDPKKIFRIKKYAKKEGRKEGHITIIIIFIYLPHHIIHVSIFTYTHIMILYFLHASIFTYTHTHIYWYFICTSCISK